MNGKYTIEVINEEKAILTLIDVNGQKQSKIVTTAAASAALAGPLLEAKDTGLLPPGILRIWETPKTKTYLIYQPPKPGSILYEGHDPINVRLPGIVMKVVASSTGQCIRSACEIFICNGDNLRPDTKLWRLRMNNYSGGYGICWGQNERLVNDILASENLFDIQGLPSVFFSSTFNRDLEYDYEFRNSFLERMVSPYRNSNRTLRYFYTKHEKNEPFLMEEEIQSSYTCLLSGILGSE